MRYKTLGKTSVKIAAIGQGCMGIGGGLTKDTTEAEQQVKSLRLGIELGMNFLDTAECYGQGYSEQLVGKAIAGKRDKVFIATKVSPENLHYDKVIISAEKSLKRIGTDYIDLYQVHWPNLKVPLQETMSAMSKLVEDGKIKYIGVCNFSLRELKTTREILSEQDIVSTQMEYNLSERIIETDILPYCEQENMTSIAYSPLDQGQILFDNKKEKTLEQIAQKYNKTKAQIILNWLVRHETVIPIPKSTNPLHIKQNAKAADFTLDKEDFYIISRTFEPSCIDVNTDNIRVVTGGRGNRKVYQTVEEAIENKLDFVPSPVDLSKDFQCGDIPKPIKIIQNNDKSSKYEYDLIEGRIRFWAWVIAHEGKKPIPAYVYEN